MCSVCEARARLNQQHRIEEVQSLLRSRQVCARTAPKPVWSRLQAQTVVAFLRRLYANDHAPAPSAVKAELSPNYLDSTSSIASRLGPSIKIARCPPTEYGSSRKVTFSARSLAIHASRSAT